MLQTPLATAVTVAFSTLPFVVSPPTDTQLPEANV
jgi:hypothetical protein